MTQPSWAICYHEAGHALTAWSLHYELKGVTCMPSRGAAGWTFLGLGGSLDSAVNDAAVLVAGGLAESVLEDGVGSRVNWFRSDPDTQNARRLLESESDVLWARRHAELVARAHVVGEWTAVEALAAELRRRRSVDGATIEEIAKANRVRKVGERRRKAFDPDRAFVDVEGERMTMRAWGDALASVAFDRRRALTLVRGEGGQG